MAIARGIEAAAVAKRFLSVWIRTLLPCPDTCKPHQLADAVSTFFATSRALFRVNAHSTRHHWSGLAQTSF